MNDPISDWKTLTNKINAGHSITSDGDVYVCDDTENNAIIVFTKNHDKFKQTQTIKNITGRPHYVKYDEATKLFYVISSEETKITTLKNNSGKVELVNTYFIDDFSNSYIRSFNIIDGYMYLISGPGYITKLKYDDNSYKIISKYDVPSELSVMNFMEKIDDYYYLSSFSNGEGVIAPMFVRIKDLNDLKDSKYEDLYNDFGFTGVPYFITKFDNAYFIPEIHFSNGIKSFEVNNNKISNIKTHYYFKK